MDAHRDDYAARGYFIERGLISAAAVEKLRHRIADVLEVGSLAEVGFDDAGQTTPTRWGRSGFAS